MRSGVNLGGGFRVVHWLRERINVGRRCEFIVKPTTGLRIDSRFGHAPEDSCPLRLVDLSVGGGRSDHGSEEKERVVLGLRNAVKTVAGGGADFVRRRSRSGRSGARPGLQDPIG
jgi:hypothetical protein